MEKQRSRPCIEVLGAYRIEPTQRLFSKAMDLKYGGLTLSKKERRDAEQPVREELSSIVLLEVSVTGRDDRFDMGDFGQEGSDQAPYDDAYLNEDGSEVIGRF